MICICIWYLKKFEVIENLEIEVIAWKITIRANEKSLQLEVEIGVYEYAKRIKTKNLKSECEPMTMRIWSKKTKSKMKRSRKTKDGDILLGLA